MALSTVPATIQGQKYISLTTFRKDGTALATPVWFGEEDDKLYIMTRSISGKYKRIRNNPQVRVAPAVRDLQRLDKVFDVDERAGAELRVDPARLHALLDLEAAHPAIACQRRARRRCRCAAF